MDVVRLMDSDLFALSTGDEFKAAVALWCKAWVQTPAGSLPNDDRILAHLSGAGARWKKVKAMALRGFELCNDDRLYHPVITEKALEAWHERQAWVDKRENEKSRKRAEREERSRIAGILRAAGVPIDWNTPTGKLRELVNALPGGLSQPVTVTGDGQSQPSHSACHAPDTAKTGQDRTGQDKEDLQELTQSKTEKSSLPKGDSDDDFSPTRRGSLALLMREAGVKVTSMHSSLVYWVTELDITDDEARQAIAKARRYKPAPQLIDPAYLDSIFREMRSEQHEAEAPSRFHGFDQLDYTAGLTPAEGGGYVMPE